MTVRRTRAGLAAEVAWWRTKGRLPMREVAELLGISCSYAYDLVCDPSGEKVRARKDSYRGTCSRCGNPTDGSNGRAKAPDLCASCAAAELHKARYWTAERIVDAIQRFAALHGRPPSAREWIRVDRAGGYPNRGSIYMSSAKRGSPFPTWAAAIEAAGFPRPQRGMYAREGERGLYRIQRCVLAVLRAQRASETPTGQIIRKSGHRHRQSVSQALRSLERRGLASHVRRGYWTAT